MVLRTLTEALQKLANEELNEDTKRIETDLETFRIWIDQQPHLKSRTTDQFLIAFLRSCKHNLEEAKLKLDNFYALKVKYPELLNRPKLDDEKFRKLLKCGICLYLPKPLTETGPRICLIRNGAYDPSKHSFAEISQMRQLMQDIILYEDDIAVVGGLIYIMDFGDVTKSHFFQINPGNMRKISQYAEQGVPLNVIATHFIDTPTGFGNIYNLVRTFMSENVKKRMFVHGSNRDDLFKTIPKEILPKEYGGDNGSLQELIDHWEQKVLSYADFFEEDTKYGVDETLRVKNCNDSPGLMGSFRKFFH